MQGHSLEQKWLLHILIPKGNQENAEIPQTSLSPHTTFLKMALMHYDTTEMILQTIAVPTKTKERLKDVPHLRLAGFCTP